MDRTELERLRALAEAATPSPWEVQNFTHKPLDTNGVVNLALEVFIVRPGAALDHDVAYIAAVNPQTTLSLLDSLAAATQRAEKAEAACGVMRIPLAEIWQRWENVEGTVVSYCWSANGESEMRAALATDCGAALLAKMNHWRVALDKISGLHPDNVYNAIAIATDCLQERGA